MQPGPKNCLCDIEGLQIGHAHDARVKTGTTVLLAEHPMTASVDVRGGAPGTRETDLLHPSRTVETVDALVLSGGSAFGLEAASAIHTELAARGRGFAVGPARIPIVPAAILFDMVNGGAKDWGRSPPYRALGLQALDACTRKASTLGSCGAGYGALTADLKGGFGTASFRLENGLMVGAAVAVNAVGSATIGQTGRFWAAPFEQGEEFGGMGVPDAMPDNSCTPKIKQLLDPDAPTNTTIAIVATNATLTKAQTNHLAVMAQDGLARALAPVHTPMDGDLVFALASGEKGLENPVTDLLTLGHAASLALARAIARAIYHAKAEAGDVLPTWQQVYGT